MIYILIVLCWIVLDIFLIAYQLDITSTTPSMLRNILGVIVYFPFVLAGALLVVLFLLVYVVFTILGLFNDEFRP